MQKWQQNAVWKGYKKKYNQYWLVFIKFNKTNFGQLTLVSPYLQGIVTPQFFSSPATFKDTVIQDVKQAIGNYKAVQWGFFFFNPLSKQHLHSWVSIFQNFGQPPIIFRKQKDKVFSVQNGKYIDKPMIFLFSPDVQNNQIVIKILTGALSMGQVKFSLVGSQKPNQIELKKSMQQIRTQLSKKNLIFKGRNGQINSVQRFSNPNLFSGISIQNEAYIDQWARVQGNMRSVGTIIRTVGKHDKLDPLLKKIRSYIKQSEVGQDQGHPIWMLKHLIVPYATFFSSFSAAVLQQVDKQSNQGNQVSKASFKVQMLQFSRRIRIFNFYCVRMTKQYSKQNLQGVLTEFQFLMGASARIYQMIGGQNSNIGIQWEMIQRAIILAEALGQFVVLSENQGSEFSQIHDRPGTWDDQVCSSVQTQNFISQSQDMTKEAIALGNMVDTQILVLSQQFSQFRISQNKEEKAYSRVVVVQNNQQAIQAKEMSQLLQKNIPVATLVLIQHKIQRIQELSKIIVAQVQLIKSGKIFRRQDNYNHIAINSSLLLSLSKQLSVQIDFLKMKKPTDYNSPTPDFFVLLEGRLRLVTSTTLKICIQNNIVRMANSQSTNINLELIQDLNIKDQKQLILNFSLIAVILDSKLSDKMKLEAMEIFQISQKPYQDLVKKFGDKINIFDQKAINIIKECQKYQTILQPAASEYRFNQKKQKYLQKVVQRKKDLIKLMDSDVKDSSQILSKEIQVLLPKIDDSQVKAAVSLVNMRHRNILQVKESDYLLNCKAIGYNYNQLAQIQNSAQIPNTRALVPYTKSNVLANVVDNNISALSLPQFNKMIQIQQQQVLKRMVSIQGLLEKIYGRQQQMFSEIKQINQTTKQIKDLISNQTIILTKQISTLSKFPFSDEFRRAKIKLQYLTKSSAAIQYTLAANKNDMINQFSRVLQKLDQISLQSNQKQQLTINLVKQLQGTMNSVELSSQAGIKQLSEMLSLGYKQTKDLIQTGFITGQQERGKLANMIIGNSNQINKTIEQLALAYKTGNSQQKSACYHIFQGLYTIFTQFKIKSTHDTQNFGALSEQLKSITSKIGSIDNILGKMTSNVEHIVKNYSQQLYNVIVQSNQQVTSGLSFLQTQAAAISGQIQDNQLQIVQYLNMLGNKISQQSHNSGLKFQNQTLKVNDMNQKLMKQLGNQFYDAMGSGVHNISNQIHQYNTKIQQTIKAKQKLAQKSEKLRNKLIVLLTTINKGQQLSQLSDDGLIQKVRTSLQEIVKKSDKVSKYNLHLRTFMTLLAIDPDTTPEADAQIAITQKIQSLKMKGIKWEQQQQIGENIKSQTQKSLNNVTNQMSKLKAQIKQKQILITELRGQITFLKTDLSGITGRENGLKGQIQEKRGRIEQLQRSLQGMKRVHEVQLKNQLQLSKGELNQKLATLKTHNESLIDLKNQQMQSIRRSLKDQKQKYILQLDKLKKQKNQALERQKIQLQDIHKAMMEAATTSSRQALNLRQKELLQRKNQIQKIKQQRVEQINRQQNLLARSYKNVIEEKNLRLTEKDNQIIQLQQSLKDLQKKMKTQKARQLQQKQTQIIKLGKKVQNLQAKVSDKTTEIQNANNLQRVQQLTNQLSVATRALQTLRVDNQRTLSAEKVLSHRLQRQKDQAITKLFAANELTESANRTKSELQQRINAANTKITNLTNQIQNKQTQHLREIQSAKFQGAQSKKSQIQDLRTRLAQENLRLETLKSQKQQIRIKLNKAEIQTTRLTGIVSNFDQKIIDLKASHSQALQRNRELLTKATAQIQALKDKLNQQTHKLKQQIDLLKQQQGKAKRQLKQQKNLLTQIRLQLQKQRGLLKNQKGQTQNAQLKVIQLDGEIAVLKSKINTAEEQMSRAKQKIVNVQKEMLLKQSEYTIQKNNQKYQKQIVTKNLQEALGRIVQINKAKQIAQKKSQNQTQKLQEKIKQLQDKNQKLVLLVTQADSLKQHYNQILNFYSAHLTKKQLQILEASDKKISFKRQKLLTAIERNMQKKVELIKQLHLEIENQKQKVSELQQQINTLSNAKKSLAQQINILQLESQKNLAIQARLNGEISSLKTSKQQLQTKLQESQTKIRKLQKQSQQNLKTISQLTNFKTRCAQLQTQNKTLKQTKKLVQQAYEEHKKQTLNDIQQLKNKKRVIQELLEKQKTDKRMMSQLQLQHDSIKNQIQKKKIQYENWQIQKKNLTNQIQQVRQSNKSLRMIATRMRNMHLQLAGAVEHINSDIKVLQMRIQSIFDSGATGQQVTQTIIQYQKQIAHLKETLIIMKQRAKIAEINSAGGHKPLDDTGLWEDSKSIKAFKKIKQNKKQKDVGDILDKLDQLDLSNSQIGQDFIQSEKEFKRQTTKPKVAPVMPGSSFGTQKTQIKFIKLLLQTLGTAVANIFQSIQTARRLIRIGQQVRQRVKQDTFKNTVLTGLIDAYMQIEQKFVQIQKQVLQPFQQTAASYFSQSTNQHINYAYEQLRDYHFKTMAHKQTYKVKQFSLIPKLTWFPDENDHQKIDFEKTKRQKQRLNSMEEQNYQQKLKTQQFIQNSKRSQRKPNLNISRISHYEERQSKLNKSNISRRNASMIEYTKNKQPRNEYPNFNQSRVQVRLQQSRKSQRKPNFVQSRVNINLEQDQNVHGRTGRVEVFEDFDGNVQQEQQQQYERQDEDVESVVYQQSRNVNESMNDSYYSTTSNPVFNRTEDLNRSTNINK